MSQNDIPVAAHVVDTDEIARRKNREGWRTLRQFGQPAFIVGVLGMMLYQIHIYCAEQNYTLLPQLVSFPFAGLAIASFVNFNLEDYEPMLRNYLFYGSKGLLVAIAVFCAGPSEMFFQKLNDKWFENIFLDNMLHKENGFGYRTMALFLGMDRILNHHIVAAIYG